MSPETMHKIMGFYMEVLILGVILQYMVSASLSYLIPIGCIGLMLALCFGSGCMGIPYNCILLFQ